MATSHRIAHSVAMIITSAIFASCNDSPNVADPANSAEVRVSGTTRCGPAGGSFVSLLVVAGTTPAPIPPAGAYDPVHLPVSREQLGTQTFTLGNAISNAISNAAAQRCLANGQCTTAASGTVATRATSVEGSFDVTMRIRWSATDSLVVNATADWRPQLILCI